MSEIIVSTGYQGEEIRVKFDGILVTTVSNFTPDGPNTYRWHDWTLYDVGQGKYRVHDKFNSNNGFQKLIPPLTPREIAMEFPKLTNVAIEMGIFEENDCVINAEELKR